MLGNRGSARRISGVATGEASAPAAQRVMMSSSAVRRPNSAHATNIGTHVAKWDGPSGPSRRCSPNRLVALVPGYGSISGRCRLVAFLALVGDPEGNPVVEQTAPASGLPVNRTSSPGASLLTWTAGVPANSPGPEERTVKSMRLRCTRGNIVHCVAASTPAAVGSAPCGSRSCSKPGHRGAVYHDPTDAPLGAATVNRVQRRESGGCAEVQSAQLEDQRAAPPQRPKREIGQVAGIERVDFSVGADHGNRCAKPSSDQPHTLVLPRLRADGLEQQSRRARRRCRVNNTHGASIQ